MASKDGEGTVAALWPPPMPLRDRTAKATCWILRRTQKTDSVVFCQEDGYSRGWNSSFENLCYCYCFALGPRITYLLEYSTARPPCDTWAPTASCMYVSLAPDRHGSVRERNRSKHGGKLTWGNKLFAPPPFFPLLLISQCRRTSRRIYVAVRRPMYV